KLKKRFNPSASKNVNVGWINPPFYTDRREGLNVAQVAQWNEEGKVSITGASIPPRPFMRVGMAREIYKILRNKDKELSEVFSGKMNWEQFYNSLSNQLKTALQEVIKEWSLPPNSPHTVRKKGFNDPLIETGLLLQSVETEIKAWSRSEE